MTQPKNTKMKMQAGTLHGMRSAVRLALLLAAAAGLTVAAQAQAPAVAPIPFGSAIAGLATGSGNTACSTSVDIPTFSAGTHTGDGCLPTQATFSTPYDTTVDSYGNIYIADYGHYEMRVIYSGGAALTAALIAANYNSQNPTALVPQVGHIYALAGGRVGTITKSGSSYNCNGGTVGPAASSSAGDNCPGTNAYMKPRTPALDKDGNIFFTSASGGLVRVFVVNPGTLTSPTAVTTLLWANGNVATTTMPVAGDVYTLLSTTSIYSGDGGLAKSAGMYSIRDIVVDANENLYISDGNTGGTGANNNIRKINGTTAIITTFAGSPTCAQGSAGCTAGTLGGADGDGGPASAASFNSPYALFLDPSGNLYVADYQNARIRVIYQTAGSTVVNLSNPTVGNIYTIAGGGGLTATIANNGALATQLAFGAVQVAGMDQSGNIYLYDSTNRLIWKIDGKTGYAVVVVGTIGTAPAAGTYCSGTAGPKSVDTGGDGCPGPQLTVSSSGQLNFDSYGNMYETESGNAVVREFSFNTQFPATAVGSSVTQPQAYEAVTATNFVSQSFALQASSATTEFSDPGGDTCTLNTAIAAARVCVFYTKFQPAAAGLRKGSLSYGGTPVAQFLGGIGVAATVSMDPGALTTIGTGMKPNGVGTDLLGNLYIADATSKTVQKVAASGGTPATFITGLNSPSQIAVDGKGNVYVADTGNNRITVNSSTGGAAVAFATGFNAPGGVAVDSYGNVYVSDTANNRVVEVLAGGAQKVLPITGLSAPGNLALDGAGDLFVVDTGNSRVMELGATFSATAVNLGTTTFAPSGIAVDTAGDLYVLDATNLQVLSYLAGSSAGSPLLQTGLTTPVGLATDVNGSFYIADQSAAGVIAINRTLASITYPVTNLGSVSTAPLTFTNTGNANLTFTGSQFATLSGSTSSVFSLAPAASNGCSLTNPVLSGNNCLLTTTFSPIVTGNYAATVTPATSAANNGSLSGTLAGEAVLLIKSTTTITSPTTASVYYGQAITASANTSFASNGGTPVGTVQFTLDSTPLPSAAYSTSNVNTVTLPAALLTVGPHTLSVSIVFSGYVYASSQSSVSFSVVQSVTTTRLTATPTAVGASVGTLFTATILPISGANEGGSVVFFSGTPVSFSGTLTNGTSTSTLTAASSTANLVVGQTVAGTCVNSSNAVVVNLNGTITGITGSTVTFSQAAITGTSNNIVMCALPATETIYTGSGLLGTSLVSTGTGTATISVSSQMPNATYPATNFTAIYTGDKNFSGSTSAVLQPAGDFNLSTVSTSVTIPQGGAAQLPETGSGIIVTPYFGYSGTISVSCSGLPLNAYCRYQPIGATVSGTTAVPFYVVIYTDSSLTSQNRAPLQNPRMTWALLCPLGLAGLLFAGRKRVLRHGGLMVLAVLLSLGSVIGLTGCTNPVPTAPAVLTPTGSQTVGVTFTDSNTPQVSHTINFTFTVVSH